jgi:delta-aminolevulinic acid dehydratase/porphobilinogen synthase
MVKAAAAKGHLDERQAALDEDGLSDTPIVAYSAKFASAFYGPFREAADSTPAFGDRRAYQMDPANSDEAVREALLDVQEGADVVMVKPALPYLDVIRRVKEKTRLPVAAYNVSGEYAMIKAASAAGMLDERAALHEALTSIRRAGADIVLTYHAKDAARWLCPQHRRSARASSAPPSRSTSSTSACSTRCRARSRSSNGPTPPSRTSSASRKTSCSSASRS